MSETTICAIITIVVFFIVGLILISRASKNGTSKAGGIILIVFAFILIGILLIPVILG